MVFLIFKKKGSSGKLKNMQNVTIKKNILILRIIDN